MQVTLNPLNPLRFFRKTVDRVRSWVNGPEIEEAPRFSTWFSEVNPPDRSIDKDGEIYQGMSEWAQGLRERRRKESLPDEN